MDKSAILSHIKQHYGFKSDAEFARFLGITPQTLSNWGARNSVDYELLSTKCVDVDANWLLTGNGEMLKTVETSHLAIQSTNDDKNAVYLYDVSAAAGYGGFDEIIHKNNIVGKYVVPNFGKIDFMIYVQGSSMYPKYGSGDIVACRVLHESRFIQWGKPYVVATREHGLLVKRLHESEKCDCIKAVSDNPNYPPFDIPKDEVLGIALVAGVIRLE